MITWTIGAGGLLGSAIDRRSTTAFTGSDIPWGDPDLARQAISADFARFTRLAGEEPWAIAWAAGSATVGSSSAHTAVESAHLRWLLRTVSDSPPPGRGAFFLASSAGGVYAGCQDPPFDATTPPVPISAYGELKLDQEAAAAEILEGVCPLVIGRMSNLYGPGQNLAKLQGLISRLALAALTHRPINIFVPLGTIRDYVYVDDAADAAVRLLEDAAGGSSSASSMHIIASGEGTTIAQLLRIAQDISRKRVPVALGSHASARSQAPDLRFVPTPVPGSEQRIATPLPVGMKRVFDSILGQLQARPPSEVG